MPAWANGRLPAASQLVVAPSDPTFMALRATFGVIVSHDSGNSWYWICETATGYDAQEIQDPSLGITANNSLIVGLREGLAVSHDNECDWHYVAGPLGHTSIVDVVTRPDTPSTILALSSQASGTDDAGDTTYTSQVLDVARQRRDVDRDRDAAPVVSTSSRRSKWQSTGTINASTSRG